MDIDINDSDFSDSDVFVLKQIKPVKNSSQLMQLTLPETSVIKEEINSLSDKSTKKSKGSKHANHSMEIKCGKIKGTVVCRDGTAPKKLSKAANIVKNKSNTQCARSSKKTVGKGVERRNFKECFYSNCLKKEKEGSSKESKNLQKVNLGSPLNIYNTWNKQENICEKNEKLSVLKNLEMHDINESLSEEKVRKSLIDGNDREPFKKKCRVDEWSKKSDENILKTEINLKIHSNISGNSTVKEELNLEFSFDNFKNNITNDTGTSSEKEKFNDNSNLLCFLLKKIIKDELAKQTALQSESLKNGKAVEKLLLDCECEMLEKFFNLNENPCKVFVRMLSRKKGWHRICSLSYPDISNNLCNEFEILHKVGLIDINIEDEDLKTQLDLLSKPEVLELCKYFNVSVKSSSSAFKKESLIINLINVTKKQKSIFEMLKGENSTTRLDLLKSKVKNYLGLCIRLNDEILKVFHKIFLLSSFAHYQDDESKRFSNELFMHMQIYKNIIRFPNYKVSPTVIFETMADFEDYKNSLSLQDTFEIAINNKNYDIFVSTYHEAKVEFKKLLENNEYQKRFLNLKPYLRKFSAGTVYARILTKFCKTFKKQTTSSEIVSTAQLLLGQNLFLPNKKGEWYEILSKAFENQKLNNAAAELIIKSLEDPLIDEVQKLTLQLRGQSVLKKKTYGISDVNLRNILGNLCTLSVLEPTSVEIKGKALDGNESGFKSVYVQEFEHGKVYSTVEERAVSYYRTKGFTKGCHSEGCIIQSIYFLLFFDIIYGLSPEGVFQSPYQKAPLDFASGFFFHNRKEEIELLMNDMLSWDEGQIEAKIKGSYYTNYNSICIVSWDDKFTPELFCEIISCITMPILVSIFHRLVKNFRISRSGFPDLTLWNPDTKKCKFVEVKGPSDKLSPAQRIWLNYLRDIGLDCEVCNVRNISSKNFE